MSQASLWLSWASSFRFLRRRELQSFSWGCIHFQAHNVVGRILFLTGSWSEGRSSFQAVAWRLPFRVSPQDHWLPEWASKSLRKNVHNVENFVSYNLILEVTSFTSKIRPSARSAGGHWTRWEYQEAEITGNSQELSTIPGMLSKKRFLKIYFKPYDDAIYKYLLIVHLLDLNTSNEFVKPPLSIMYMQHPYNFMYFWITIKE